MGDELPLITIDRQEIDELPNHTHITFIATDGKTQVNVVFTGTVGEGD